MLEKETSKVANELIRGMCRFCTKSFEEGEAIDSDDLNALAALIAAVNDVPFAPSPVVGFMASEDAYEDD